MGISVAILAQNSAETIQRTLESVKSFSEIIVIDGGSSDATPSIASQYKAKVLFHPFSSYADQRNWAIKQCKNEWVLFVDSDEAVSSELSDYLHKFINNFNYDENNKNNKNKKVLFGIFRIEYLLGQSIDSGHGRSNYQLRFFLRDEISYQGEIHENPNYQGKQSDMNSAWVVLFPKNACLYHNEQQTLDSFVLKIGRYSYLKGLDKIKQGRAVTALELMLSFPVTLALTYAKSWRNGSRGLMLSIMHATYITLSKTIIYQNQILKSMTKRV